ncbi:MAG: aminoglycoside phosphotransferase family protein [Micromonosporaceae bacterium]
MTTDDAATLTQACTITGLDCQDAVLLRRHATAVYHLPRAGAVARIASIDHLEQSRLSVQVTRWLLGKGFPATAPLDVDQPVVVEDSVVTFWRYYPQDSRELPPVRELSRILRQLHTLEPPPFPLPAYEPLKGFMRELATHGSTVLSAEEHKFLQRRANELLDAYRCLESHLGHSMIHGDPRTGNLLWDGEDVVLGDWDSVSHGPRELDLIITYQGVRYGRSADTLDEFATIYGWDIRSWPGYDLLRDLRDLHTLSAPLRLARHRADVAEELHHRLMGLQAGDHGQQWRSF